MFTMIPFPKHLPENRIGRLEDLVANLQKKVRKLEKDCQRNATTLSTKEDKS